MIGKKQLGYEPRMRHRRSHVLPPTPAIDTIKSCVSCVASYHHYASYPFCYPLMGGAMLCVLCSVLLRYCLPQRSSYFIVFSLYSFDFLLLTFPLLRSPSFPNNSRKTLIEPIQPPEQTIAKPTLLSCPLPRVDVQMQLRMRAFLI
ncbi:hypothetical protein BDQ17DRAFT_630804 [Cyathus striatus]|nr:hypothetical protein BDQ17DRAFT_630804 [Cyathus striatus]